MENLTALSNSFKSEMAIFDELAKTYLDSDVELINQIAHHIVNSGGKKLTIIYSDWSVPLELEKSRTQNCSSTEEITILDDHKSPIIYPPIGKMIEADIKQFEVETKHISINS